MPYTLWPPAVTGSSAGVRPEVRAAGAARAREVRSLWRDVWS